MERLEDIVRTSVSAVMQYCGRTAPEENQEMIFGFCIDKKDEELQINRIRFLKEQLKEPPFISVLSMALAQYFYPPIYYLLRESTGQGVTMNLALSMSGGQDVHSIEKLRNGYGLLRRILKTETEVENFLFTELYADERLVMFLMGSNSPDKVVRECCELYEAGKEKPICVGMEKEAAELAAILEKLYDGNKKCILQISGKKDSGRKTLLREAACRQKVNFLFIDYNVLKAGEDSQVQDRIKQIQREQFLNQCSVCYYNVEKDGQDVKECILDLVKVCKANINYPVCVITEKSTNLISLADIPVKKYPIFTNSKIRNAEIWSYYGAVNNVEIDSFKYGARYKFYPGQIRKVIESYSLKGGIENIDRVCESVQPLSFEGSLQKVRTKYTFEDIKISEKQRSLLNNLCSQAEYGRQVYEEWGMEEKYPYGRAVTAMFSGPPGTGKTMAASAVGNNLGLPVYRVNLSGVLDKYIGETEKKLEEIFCACDRSNVVLFFDEADALLGKRSEIHDAKDKFANGGVSFILQRIEDYDGVVILATNLKNNIDDAFLRRMKYIIEFNMPDASTRKSIWQSGFSKSIPTGDIDFDYLGENVELSGGYIKNIIINGAFMAAAENTPVAMEHLLRGVAAEYEKLGIIAAPEEFGRYGYIFKAGNKEERGI